MLQPPVLTQWAGGLDENCVDLMIKLWILQELRVWWPMGQIQIQALSATSVRSPSQAEKLHLDRRGTTAGQLWRRQASRKRSFGETESGRSAGGVRSQRRGHRTRGDWAETGHLVRKRSWGALSDLPTPPVAPDLRHAVP